MCIRDRVNVSAYHMDWTNTQVLFFNPVALGNTTFGTNGPNYSIHGVELQFIGRVTDGLTVQGSSSYNHSKQTNSPCLVGNIPGSPTNGQCITEVNGQPFPNPFGAEGGEPANSPALQANLRGRYDMTFNDYKTFLSFGGNFVGHSYNQMCIRDRKCLNPGSISAPRHLYVYCNCRAGAEPFLMRPGNN